MGYQSESEIGHKKSLLSKDFKTDRAKDRAYMEHQEKADAVAQALEAKGIQLGGVEFFDHQSRRDILGESLKNYTPTMFALNSSAQNRIENPIY